MKHFNVFQPRLLRQAGIFDGTIEQFSIHVKGNRVDICKDISGHFTAA